MARNVSVERYKKLTEELRNEVRAIADAETMAQMENLARVIESVAPQDEGILKTTVRVIRNRKGRISVIAGDQKTVRENVSTKPYNYARADEFGTVNMRARPFFFGTYRLMKKKMRAAVSRKITAAIKKRSSE